MKNIYQVLLILFILFFTLFIRDSLVYEALGGYVTISSRVQYYILILLLITVSYTLFIVKSNRLKPITPIRGYDILLISIIIISLFWSIFNPLGSISTYLKLILPIFIFHFSYNIIQQLLNIRFLYKLLTITLIVLSITYFQYFQEILFLSGKDQTVTNSSYYLLYLLPLFLSSERKITSYLAVLVVLIAVFMSSKRGGTIAFLFGMLSYALVNFVLLKHRKHKLLRLLVFAIFIIAVVYFSIGTISSGDYLLINRMMDIADSGGSGRDVVWERTFKMIQGSGIVNFVFGHGFDRVVIDSPLHLSAHNDFLEILYDFGFPVLIMYILFHVKFVKRIILMIKQGSKYAGSLAASYAIFFVASMVSHIVIYPHYLAICSFVWGAILGQYNKEQSVLINS